MRQTEWKKGEGGIMRGRTRGGKGAVFALNSPHRALGVKEWFNEGKLAMCTKDRRGGRQKKGGLVWLR